MELLPLPSVPWCEYLSLSKDTEDDYFEIVIKFDCKVVIFLYSLVTFPWF